MELLSMLSKFYNVLTFKIWYIQGVLSEIAMLWENVP